MKKLIILFAFALISTSSFSQGEMDNVFYFRAGYSIPSWKYFGATKNNFHGFEKSGAMLEMGQIYMLNNIPMPGNMAIGLNIDFISIYWHQFSNNNTNEDIGTLRFDSKIGPSFTYSPVNNLAFDVYVKADISWVAATAFVQDDNADDADGYGKVGTIGLSTGFNVRYSILMFGVELNTISPKLENVDNKGEYLGNWNNSSSDKSPLPSVSFSLGLNF